MLCRLMMYQRKFPQALALLEGPLAAKLKEEDVDRWHRWVIKIHRAVNTEESYSKIIAIYR